MRKILIFCLILLSLENLAYAETKTYNVDYTSEEVSQIIGESFSTAYFNEQYEKLALLQRCELNLKTIPLPLLNLYKYTELENEKKFSLAENLNLEDVSKLKETLRIDKIGKHKLITIVHHYSEKLNEENEAENKVISYTSFASVNDKLYLTNLVNTEKATKDETSPEKKEETIFEKIRREKSGETSNSKEKVSAEQEVEKIKNINPKEINSETSKKLWDEHTKIIKQILKATNK